MPTKIEMQFWIDNDAKLRELWNEGLSASKIGKRLGCTKNAVVGRAHRIELPDRGSPIGMTRDPSLPPYQHPPKRPAKRPASVGPTLPPLPSAAMEGSDVAREHDRGMAVPTVAPKPPQTQREIVRHQMFGLAATKAMRVPTLPSLASLTLDGPQTVFKPRRLSECCWPIGEPGTKGFRYCDELAPVPGKPYCEPHTRLSRGKSHGPVDDTPTAVTLPRGSTHLPPLDIDMPQSF